MPQSRTGWSAGGKRAEQRIRGDYLDAALDNFSGYIAADELYDGPFCVLSIVDNYTFRRLIYEVLDHDPDQADIERFFRTSHISSRIALDMQREERAAQRDLTTRALHRARSRAAA
jgi:hypothetical protein